jgi:hypothetical protein
MIYKERWAERVFMTPGQQFMVKKYCVTAVEHTAPLKTTSFHVLFLL